MAGWATDLVGPPKSWLAAANIVQVQQRRQWGQPTSQPVNRSSRRGTALKQKPSRQANLLRDDDDDSDHGYCYLREKPAAAAAETFYFI